MPKLIILMKFFNKIKYSPENKKKKKKKTYTAKITLRIKTRN